MFPTEKVNGSGIYDIDQQRHLPQMEIQEKLGVMQYKILPVLTSYNQKILRTAMQVQVYSFCNLGCTKRTNLPKTLDQLIFSKFY